MAMLRSGRMRLVDGLVLAAGALLVLKAVAFLSSPGDRDFGPDGLPRFARVLAHARTNYVPPDPLTTGSVPETPKAAAPAGPSAGVSDAGAVGPAPAVASPAERAIYDRLGERREELQQRARELEARERLIEDGERRLDSKAIDATAADANRAGDAAKAAEAEASALKGIVIMYETMKPKEAARLFDRLPHDVLVPVVRLVAPRKMAEILAAMSPDKAEKLTVALARRSPADGAGTLAASSGLPVGELPGIDLPPARSAGPPR